MAVQMTDTLEVPNLFIQEPFQSGLVWGYSMYMQAAIPCHTINLRHGIALIELIGDILQGIWLRLQFQIDRNGTTQFLGIYDRGVFLDHTAPLQGLDSCTNRNS